MKIDFDNLFSLAIIVCLAVLGHTVKMIRLSEQQKITVKEFAKGSAISAFIGLLGYWICDYIGASGSLTYVIICVAGYLGPVVIDKLGEVLMGSVDMLKKK